MKHYPSQDWAIELEEIMACEPYSLVNAEKQRRLLPIIKTQVAAAACNPSIESYFRKIGFHPNAIQRLVDVPFIPVQMFKEFDLVTCEPEDVFRVVQSSATTSQVPSRVPLNKATSMRQTKGLIATLKSFLGSKRRPFLVLDTAEVNAPGTAELSARGAAIRGLSSFAKRMDYLMKREERGGLVMDEGKVDALGRQFEDQEVYLFGFTFIIWSVFVPAAQRLAKRLRFKEAILFHSGGWKKLTGQSVTKEQFNQEVARLFDADKLEIIDFYGMAEQIGVIFPDCQYLNKHVPEFAEVIIRDPYSLEECRIGQTGLIEVMSALSDSYYSQALLTEDLGVLVGVDDCPCGRKGKYFRFVSRVEQAEIRGCGDTFAVKEGQ